MVLKNGCPPFSNITVVVILLLASSPLIHCFHPLSRTTRNHHVLARRGKPTTATEFYPTPQKAFLTDPLLRAKSDFYADASIAFRDARENLIPTIPLQPSQRLSLRDQFRPRFILKEFLYGVKYICQVHWLLMAASMLMRIVTFKLLNYAKLNTFLIGLGLPNSVSIVHAIENMAKLSLNRYIPLSRALCDCLVAPVLEELSYRGLGHWSNRLDSRIDLWTTSAVTSWSSKLSLATLGLALISPFLGILRLCLGAPNVPSVQLIASLASFVGCLLIFPANWEIFNMTRNYTASTTSAATNTTSKRLEWKKICHLDAPPQLDDSRKPTKIRRLLSLNARWASSCAFGAAHYTDQLGHLPGGMVVAAQKCLGTIGSSLLVESRLAVNRCTLWGCIGAHIMFNSLAQFSPMLRTLSAGMHPLGGFILQSHWTDVLGCGLLVLFLHKIMMDFFVNRLDRLEEKYLS